MYRDGWKSLMVDSVYWTDTHAEVVCRQLGYEGGVVPSSISGYRWVMLHMACICPPCLEPSIDCIVCLTFYMLMYSWSTCIRMCAYMKQLGDDGNILFANCDAVLQFHLVNHIMWYLQCFVPPLAESPKVKQRITDVSATYSCLHLSFTDEDNCRLPKHLSFSVWLLDLSTYSVRTSHCRWIFLATQETCTIQPHIGWSKPSFMLRGGCIAPRDGLQWFI